VLIRQIASGAKAAGLSFEIVRRSSHEMWSLGGTLVVIPGHRDIAEGTARDIRRDLQPILGERWWER
jgi:hypothetical protein